MNNADEVWMRRCFAIARKGIGKASPNPLVGAVIVKNGKLVGEGYHKYYGGAHAEINAIINAKQKGYKVYGATIYINLEPCFHFGNTPPCVDTIIANRFSRVVIGMKDPNPLVAGKSIQKLKRNNIQCSIGVLQNEAEDLNEIFSKYITSKIPFVALKIAQTSDGFIARSDGSSRWITNKLSREYVHQLRNEYDAVLVGATTVKKDDPELTVRHVKGRNPLRVVVDGSFSIPIKRKIFNGKAKTILFISKQALLLKREKAIQLKEKNINIVALHSRNNVVKIKDILRALSKRNIASILVEGGSQIYTAFLKEKFIDKIYVFTNKRKFKNGLRAFNNVNTLKNWRVLKEQSFGNDVMEELY